MGYLMPGFCWMRCVSSMFSCSPNEGSIILFAPYSTTRKHHSVCTFPSYHSTTRKHHSVCTFQSCHSTTKKLLLLHQMFLSNSALVPVSSCGKTNHENISCLVIMQSILACFGVVSSHQIEIIKGSNPLFVITVCFDGFSDMTIKVGLFTGGHQKGYF